MTARSVLGHLKTNVTNGLAASSAEVTTSGTCLRPPPAARKTLACQLGGHRRISSLLVASSRTRRRAEALPAYSAAFETAGSAAVDARQVVSRLFSLFNKRDLSSVMAMLAPEVRYENMSALGKLPITGKQEVLRYLLDTVVALPEDSVFVIDEMTEGQGKIGIAWHLEMSGVEVPLSRCLAMYTLDGDGRLTGIRDSPQSDTSLALPALQAVSPLLRGLGPTLLPAMQEIARVLQGPLPMFSSSSGSIHSLTDAADALTQMLPIAGHNTQLSSPARNGLDDLFSSLALFTPPWASSGGPSSSPAGSPEAAAARQVSHTGGATATALPVPLQQPPPPQAVATVALGAAPPQPKSSVPATAPAPPLSTAGAFAANAAMAGEAAGAAAAKGHRASWRNLFPGFSGAVRGEKSASRNVSIRDPHHATASSPSRQLPGSFQAPDVKAGTASLAAVTAPAPDTLGTPAVVVPTVLEDSTAAIKSSRHVLAGSSRKAAAPMHEVAGRAAARLQRPSAGVVMPSAAGGLLLPASLAWTGDGTHEQAATSAQSAGVSTSGQEAEGVGHAEHMTNMTGLWSKVAELSEADSYDAMMDLLQLSGMQKMTARLIEALDIHHDHERFDVNFVTVVPYFKVTEANRFGRKVHLTRRDLRSGKQSSMTEAINGGAGGVLVSMEWAAPLAGQLSEVYSLRSPELLSVKSTITIGGRTNTTVQVYRRSSKDKNQLLKESRARAGNVTDMLKRAR